MTRDERLPRRRIERLTRVTLLPRRRLRRHPLRRAREPRLRSVALGLGGRERRGDAGRSRKHLPNNWRRVSATTRRMAYLLN